MMALSCHSDVIFDTDLSLALLFSIDRERIIHLLALKPYKKPEIVVRLITDGISEKEKLKIPVALKEVKLHLFSFFRLYT